VNGHKVETMFSRHMGEAPQWLVDEAAWKLAASKAVG
jgi:hypothetical protein